jgi:hypothetical protein
MQNTFENNNKTTTLLLWRDGDGALGSHLLLGKPGAHALAGLERLGHTVGYAPTLMDVRRNWVGTGEGSMDS